MLKHTIRQLAYGGFKIAKSKNNLIGTRVNDETLAKILAKADKEKKTKSKILAEIIEQHFTQSQQTFLDVWRIQPKSLYCPLYGWSDFAKTLNDCQSCQYRTGRGRTKCSMWYKRTGLYSEWHDPQAKIKHKM